MESIKDSLGRRFKDPKLRAQYDKLFAEVIKDPDVAKFLKENQNKLPRRNIETGFSKLYEYVTVRDKIKNGQKTFLPGYAPKLIVSDHHIEVTYEATQKLINQQKRQKRLSLVKMINLPKSLHNAQIEDYDIQGREISLQAALTFIDECIDYKTTNQFPKGLYLSGSLGVGKTYLLAAIANKLAENDIQSLLIHFPTFSVEMMGAIRDQNTTEFTNKVKKVPILMIDDIGANRLTSWMRDDVLGIILEYRMQNELPTLFSSNYSMEELQSQYLSTNNKGDVEPLKAMRIMERIKFLATEYKMVGPNRRNPEN